MFLISPCHKISNMRFPIYFSIVLFIFCGCKKEEELLKGTICGLVYTRDQYNYPVGDQSGAKVTLYHDSEAIDSTYTDSKGWYSFNGFPYGEYTIIAEKDLFIQSRGGNSLYHIGGYSPTLKNTFLFEIPTYKLDLDKVGFTTEYILVFLRFNGDTLLPDNTYGFPLRVFAGTSPDVSRDNFVSSGKAYLTDYDPENYNHKIAVHARIQEWEMDDNFKQLKQGTIYLRIYPLAIGQGYWIYEYDPKALGPPSDVISFVWNDVVSGNR
jgi:hypothetical protein